MAREALRFTLHVAEQSGASADDAHVRPILIDASATQQVASEFSPGGQGLPPVVSESLDLRPTSSPRRASSAATGPVILYNRECHLCASVVAFILPPDLLRRFRFAAL